MTFDELWRLDLWRRPGADPTAARREVERFDNPALDDPDEAEVSRFIEWLEKSLMSGHSDGLSVR
jgi:hypothetical protein